MKKIALWSVCFLLGCGPPDEPLLLGIWRYDIQAMRAYLSEEQPSQQTVNYMEGIMAPLEHARLEFQAGGKLNLFLGEETVAGSWRFRKGRQKLTLNLTGQNSTYRVEVLSDSLLLLRPEPREEVSDPLFPRALVPVE